MWTPTVDEAAYLDLSARLLQHVQQRMSEDGTGAVTGGIVQPITVEVPNLRERNRDEPYVRESPTLWSRVLCGSCVAAGFVVP